MKPSFLLSEMEANELPVVFLDCDLEFHRFPDLFMPGSWPRYGRDVALFNFWANETLPQIRNRPHIGSGVAYFNRTKPAKDLLNAWAEAMAYPPNERAPDDQVLDRLLTEGEWLKRASYGWLPTSCALPPRPSPHPHPHTHTPASSPPTLLCSLASLA